MERLEIATERMDATCIPHELPWRNHEKKCIKEFIITSLESGGSQTSLYISGMPGTGKTATTIEIINELKKDKNLPGFKFVQINGMSLSKPEEVYTILCNKILKKTYRPSTAAMLLENFFLNKKKVNKKAFTLLLLDELDALITKKQDLLYNLFNWPALENSKLIIVAIANTMNLPEKFMGKIKSRIGEKRLVYQPYTSPQIKIILESRLRDVKIFSSDALNWVSEKVSSISGDFRRALQVCKRAVDICKYEQLNTEKSFMFPFQQMIQFEHIMKSFDELFNNKTAQVCLG